MPTPTTTPVPPTDTPVVPPTNGTTPDAPTPAVLKWSDIKATIPAANATRTLAEFVGQTVRIHSIKATGKNLSTFVARIGATSADAVDVKVPKSIARGLAEAFRLHPSSVLEAAVEKGEKKVRLA